MTDILVISGLSGAGRSQAAADLDDLGWFVVDNLPTALFEKVAELGSQPGSAIERLALVVGSGAHQADILDVIGRLRTGGHRVRVLFLDASTPELVRRYTSTRRKHPVEDDTVVGAIERERELLEAVRGLADIVLDTTDLNVHQLKARISDLFATESAASGMQTTITSFGYKNGLPLDVDLVFDCRFLPNPYWVERLRDQTGQDEAVREYVLRQKATAPFLDKLLELFELLLPAYAAEGKSYLTVGIGCTGGRHRSVVVAEELARRLRRRGYEPRVQHRDVERDG